MDQKFITLPDNGNISRTASLRTRRHAEARAVRSQAANIVVLVVAITVLLVPFDAVVTVSALGEMAHESYAIINLTLAPVVIFVLVATRSFYVPRSLLLILALILFGILASFIVNLDSIMAASAKGRHGFEKFFTSAMIPIFGVYISLLIFLGVSKNFKACFAYPLACSTLFVVCGGLLQLAAALFSPLQAMSVRFFLLTHAGFDRFDQLANRLGDMSGLGSLRITSTLFEPADFGTFVIYVLPWILSGLLSNLFTQGKTIPTSWSRVIFISATLLMLVLAMFSGRTAALGAPAIVVIYLGLYFCVRIVKDQRGLQVLSAIVVGSAVVLYVLPLWIVSHFTDALVQSVVENGSTSNISRLGTVVILLNLFGDHPFFGVGMGQYGFYVAQYLPSWAYTFEFRRWIGDLNSSFFPSFSIFAKIAGEMGMIGLIIWIGFLGALLQKVFKHVQAMRRSGWFPYFGIAIATNFFSLGLTGLGIASYRVFWIWALLGLAAAYISNPFAIDSAARAALSSRGRGS